ncbi:MAG: ParB N-terminal domain-containing protein [Amylibacter sp.]|nr:ParB N-terminal domain-containing protein [Amylibacter sp.]
MRDAKLLETTDILITDIDTDDRLRPVSDVAVQSLVVSIEQLGVMMDEIHVRKIAHQDGKLRLIAGGHRIAAALAMEWEKIPTKIWDCTDDWAELLEIDDNLAHADLDALDLAVFLSKRKRIYEKLHPETKAGVAGANSRWNATELGSFASTAAEKRGITERQIRKIVAVGDGLSPFVIAKFRAMKKPATLKDLQNYAKIKDGVVKAEVLNRLKSSKSVAEALQKVSPLKSKYKDPIDEDHMKLFELWKRSSKEAKRRFVRDFEEEITGLIAEFGGSDAKR